MASMHKLIKNGDLAGVQRAPDTARLLIERGAKLDLQENHGNTALMFACRYDQPDTAQLLIERGAKLDLHDNGGWTALMFACRYDQPDTARLLIERGAKLDLQTDNGHTALMLACQQPSKAHHTAWGLLRCIKLCYGAGADLNLIRKSGNDALALAKIFKRADAVAFLEFANMLEVARGVQGRSQQPRSVVAASLLSQDLTEFFAEQLLRKDPVASLADFDGQHTILRKKEQELIALQKAVKTNSKKVSKRNRSRRDLVKGIRDALAGGIEGQLEEVLADPGTKAVVNSCRSLWEEILKESAVVDDAVEPATFDQVQEATRDAVEALKAWEARHDTSAACKRTEAAIDALEESTKRLGIQATFFMTLRHPEKTRHVTMELQNVEQALKAELVTLADVDPMADAPLKEVTESMKKVRQNKRKREDLERDLERIREDANDGDAEAQAKIPGLEQELAQIKSVYKLDSELRKKRARVLRHAEEHNPELLRDQKWIRSLGVNNSVPRELSTLGLWLTNAKRSDFENLAELASKPGKSVLKVRDLNGRKLVLKSFHLANDEWSSRFYRQVAALAQIKSAYIVRIQGVFMQDAHHGCALMPFYSGGDLATWIRDNPHADLATRRRIAIGLLSGLHDLHSQGFVHCDVKPENVFLAPGLSPVLGDFDGVQSHNVTMTQPMQATIKYMAPELRSGNIEKVESAVDLFSVGMVIADLFEDTEVSDATKTLISSLQSADPSKRPTALEALRHEAFQVDPVKQASCAICLDIYPVSEGVICADDHFTCKECLSRSVRAATQPNAHVNVLRDGSMCCVTPDCELLISGRTIASAVPEEDFTALLDIVRKHFERDAAVEQERQLQLRLDAALREHGLDPTTQNHIRTIQNEILTMSCPRCAAAFADFAGCCALECGACSCRFCAWCSKDTGDDSNACHRHVARCASKPAGEMDPFFSDFAVVQQAWAKLRAQRLRRYMAEHIRDAGMRASVQTRLRPLLTPDIVGDNFRFG
ncbi:Protein kinase, putative [Hondaea fermentalgiana]|uniref:Protein kinase, putative n=1 Tax=Hondaea fermentalgiana TaxID=2315210 RepID=A0A2R5GI38_9STRA|nr:Protein kinase, putative [Hondaea fermentalgiana]|eukprot:GBG30560.1 Protein kinase, putative [Hondaea fermentalgiana]